MSNCCPPSSVSQATGTFFSKRSKRYARSFKRGKLERIQQFVIRELTTQSLSEKQLLDIGCGVGKLHLTLLKHGAHSATAVDMSDEMLKQAKDFAQSFDLEGKVTHRHGDFMDIADTLPSADITLLDKVICCYEDLEGLVSLSAGKTRSTYVLIFPANNLITKIIFKIEILISRMIRSGFRPYWHDWDRVSMLLADKGFAQVNATSKLVWQAAVYQRSEQV